MAERLRLAHSVVVLEDGPGGALARVERDDGQTDYAGPLPPETARALREVAR